MSSSASFRLPTPLSEVCQVLAILRSNMRGCETWEPTLRVIDKLAGPMRKKSRGKIMEMINTCLTIPLDNNWRLGYIFIHMLSDWFFQGHHQPLLTFDEIQPQLSTFTLNPNGSVFLTMTSCKRLDLLSRTINSMIANCTDLTTHVCKWVVVDDNSSQHDRQKMKAMYPFITYVDKSPEQKGHAVSMNMIRDMCFEERLKSGGVVQYNFHIEDDFEWWYQSNFITKCIHVLEEDASYGQALINFEYTEDQKTAVNIWNRDFHTCKTDSKTRYHVHEYYETKENQHKAMQEMRATCSNYWPHFSFRPGCTRISVYEKVGRFDPSAAHFEMEYAYRYAKAGYKTCGLDCCYTVHIGRRTYERQTDMQNAYDLNQEHQFGAAPKTSSTNINPKETSHTTTQPPTQPILQAATQATTQPVRNMFVEQASEDIASGNVDGVRCYVINLERRPERLLQFFKHNNVEMPPYVVFNAIDGKALQPSASIQRIFETGDYNFRRGIVGCALSHLRIWQAFLKSPSKYCIVLEDDVKLTPKFTDKVLSLLYNHHNAFDVLFLHFNAYPNANARLQQLTHGKETFDLASYERRYTWPTAHVWSVEKTRAINMGSGAAYVLSRSGAESMCNFVNTHGMPNAVDWVLMLRSNLQIMYSQPKLAFADCWQNNVQIQSDIQTEYDSVKFASDSTWLHSEIVYWTNIVNPLSKKTTAKELTIDMSAKHACAAIAHDWKEYVHSTCSKIAVVEGTSKGIQSVKTGVAIVPYVEKPIEVIQYQWFFVGKIAIMYVHDSFLHTSVYDERPWGHNRL